MKLLYILIALLTFLVWQNTLSQSFLGEGFYYFDQQQNIITDKGLNISTIWELDNFAKFMFDVLPTFFQDNIAYYFGFQIFILILLNIILFTLVNSVTKNRVLSFTATVFFLASYIGLFEMIAVGNYQRFAQRVPNIIPALVACFYLVKYLETNKLKYYFFSIILFSFSVFIAHFSTFLLPLFVVLTLIWALFKAKLTTALKYLAVAGSFIAANALIISRDVHTPNTNIFSFIESKGIIQIIKEIFLQHANIVLPTPLIEKVASIANPYTDTLIILSSPAIILYFVGLILVWKKEIKFKVFYITCLITVPVLLFLNLYLGKVDATYNIKGYTYYFIPSFYSQQVSEDLEIKGDRAYLVPSIFISVIWASLLWLIFYRRRKTYITLTILILILYIFHNMNLVNRNIDIMQFNSKIMKDYISYSKSISNQFKQNTIVITPQPLIWPSPFIRLFYGYPQMQFISANINWEDEIKDKNKDDIFLLDYDYKNKKVLDYTLKFRTGKQVTFQGY